MGACGHGWDDRGVMTFLEQGFILLALPKTASTSLERTLAPYADEVISSPPARKHLPARGFIHTMAHDLAARGHPRGSYELVSMFREPIAWLESWWRYRGREASQHSTADISFEDFARCYLTGDTTAPIPRGRPARFISAGGAVAVDRIFSVSRPEVWSAWFSERVGVPLEFDRRNASYRDVRGELSEETSSALIQHLAPEYDVWHRLAATGEWSGARGSTLAGQHLPPGAQ